MKKVDDLPYNKLANYDKKVLIIDDDAHILSAIRRVLKQVKINPTVTNDVDEAFKILEKEHIDLVICDMVMPKMNGVDVLKKIKEIYPDILGILLTGQPDINRVIDSLNNGVYKYISKPWDDALFQQTILDTIEYKRVFDENKMLTFYLQESYKELKKMYEVVNKKFNDISSEQMQAKQVFDEMVKSDEIDLPNVRTYHYSKSMFSGDLFLHKKIDEKLFLFMGDFTGSGLPASLGVVPVKNIFHELINKKISFKKIINKMNFFLKEILPINLFCASIFLIIDFKKRKVKAWNGGSPPIIHVDENNKIKSNIKSNDVSLGILNSDKFDCTISEVSFEKGDKIYFFTDGVLEVNDFCDSKKWDNLISNSDKSLDVFQVLVDEFLKLKNVNYDYNEDATLVEVVCDEGYIR